MSDEGAGARAADWFAPYVIAVGEREQAAGGPIPGTPSLRDMQFLYAGFQSMDNCGDSMSPNDLHALMELLAEVRDSWIDPENDEIGKVLFPILDEIHASLGKSLDETVPDGAELRQRVESLRALQRAIKRREATRVPGPVERSLRWFRSKFKKQQSAEPTQ